MSASTPWILPGPDPKCYLVVQSTDKNSLAGHKQASVASITTMMEQWLASNQGDLQAIYDASHSQGNAGKTKASLSADQLKASLLSDFKFGRLVAFESRREVITLHPVVVGATSKGVDPSDWTESDRKNNTQRWRSACLHNLRNNNFRRYTRIIERRDFYRWFYRHTADLGYTTRWALAASVVATGAYEVAIMHPAVEDVGRLANSVSNELQGMMREGNQVIFDNVFPKLRQLLAGGPITGRAALEWDMRILSEEQTLIQPLYQGVSADTRRQLEQIARQQGVIAGTASYLMPNAYVDEELPYVRGGHIPPFEGAALTSIDDRWLYGMSLGMKFTPGGTGFDPAIHKRPAPSAGYVLGTELARVRTRPNLHRLDAALDLSGVGADWLVKEVETLLGRLTTAEQAELLRDQRPEGGRYSVGCRLVLRTPMFALLARWRISLEAQMRFLSSFIGGDGDGPWREMEYKTLAPLIRPFSQAEKNRLHTPYWQRIFTLVCDDDTIIDAVNDLGIQEPLRAKWINNERSWNPFWTG